MADDPNTNGWTQPPPWLAAYGPAPLQVSAPEYALPLPGSVQPQPPPPPPPPPPQKLDGTQGSPTDETPAVPAVPAPVPAAAATMQPVAVPTVGTSASAPRFVPSFITSQGQGFSPMPAEPNAAAAPMSALPTRAGDSDFAKVGLAAPGAAQADDEQLARTVSDPNASIADRQKAFSALSPEQRTSVVNNADPTQLAAIASASMQPEELAAIAVRHQQAQLHLQSAQQLELAQRQDEDARRNYQTYQSAVQGANADTQQVAMEAQRLSQEKIDTKEHGVGNFILGVLTSTIGGAVSHATGGRNLALEELDKKTQQRIDAQKADISNQWQGLGFKRNLIAESLQRSGDLYKAQEAYRVSTYDRAIGELQTKMQDYDPQGATALRAAGVVQQVQAARQTTLQTFNQQQFKNKIDASKDYRENMLAASTIKKNAADIGKTEAETAKLRGELGGGGAATGPVLPPEYYASMGLQQPPQAMSVDAYRAWTELRKTGGEASEAQTRAESTLNSSVILNPITKQPLTNKQGKAIVISPTDAKDVGDATLATQQTIDSLSGVRRALDADPSTFDRTKWAGIQAQIGGALPTLAKVYGSKFSSREETALKDITNLDYESYVRRIKDKETGKAAIDQIVTTLKRNGDTLLGGKLPDWDGKSPFLDTSKPEPSKPKPIDQVNAQLASDADFARGDRLTSTAEQSPEDQAYAAARGGANPYFTGGISQDERDELLDEAKKNPLVARALELKIPPSKLKLMNDLADRAGEGDQDANAALVNQIDGGATAEIRAYASGLMQKIAASSIPAGE